MASNIKRLLIWDSLQLRWELLGALGRLYMYNGERLMIRDNDTRYGGFGLWLG